MLAYPRRQSGPGLLCIPAQCSRPSPGAACCCVTQGRLRGSLWRPRRAQTRAPDRILPRRARPRCRAHRRGHPKPRKRVAFSARAGGERARCGCRRALNMLLATGPPTRSPTPLSLLRCVQLSRGDAIGETKTAGEKNIWIVKPTNNNRGNGMAPAPPATPPPPPQRVGRGAGSPCESCRGRYPGIQGVQRSR